MEQERGFLEAIREDPADDLHRLAWADWHDDRGDTRRADFIRAQVRAAALPDDASRDAVEDEADDLLAGHDDEWAGRLGELALEWTWRRGCVERVTVWADTLLEHGEELFALAPIREVRLLMETGDGPRLAGCRLLAQVETLDVGRDADDSAVKNAFQRDRALQALLVSPHWKRLRRLLLRGQGVEGPLVQTLIDTGLFARLEELDLRKNTAMGDRTARLLAAERSNSLASLDVLGTNVTAMGVRHLLRAASWPAMRRLGVNALLLFPHGLSGESFQHEWASTPLGPRLTSLRLDAVRMDAGALGDVMSWATAAGVEELSLNGCRLGAAGADVIAAADLSRLRRLDLNFNQLRDAGARAVATARAAGLSSLRLEGNEIGGPGVRAVAALAGLRELKLGANYVGEAGAEALAGGSLRRLRVLCVSAANLGPSAARLLAGSKSLAGLRSLDLSGNPLNDEGVKALAASPNLARLRELELDSCGIDEPGVQALADSPHLGRLKRLGLRNTFVSQREKERLAVRFGAGAMF